MEERDVEKKIKHRMLKIMSVYAIIMLLMVVVAVSIPKTITYPSNAFTDTSAEVYTEYVYVRADNEQFSEEDTQYESSTDERYTVREYMGKIGIFSEDGTLIQTIDVYTKTLPEADRRLLWEGIEIIGKQQLGELIQDYS